MDKSPLTTDECVKLFPKKKNLEEVLLQKLQTNPSNLEWLVTLLGDLAEQHQSSSPIPALNEAFAAYVEYTTKKDAKFTLNVLNLIRLITFLSELYSTFDVFDMETDFINLSIESENGHD